MKKNTKILLILIIIILIPIVYFTATTMLNQMEQDRFYETIKNVSNNENNSDKSISEHIQNNNNDRTSIEINTQTSKTLNESIKTLTDLEESLHNETLKEYVNLEITRMEDEEKYWESYSEDIQKGIKSKQTNDKGIIINHDKQNAADFLNKHPDIKDRFEKLGIDEDFMVVENAEVDFKVARNK